MPARQATAAPHVEFLARGVLLRGSSILACRNLKHGYLYLPGGHVEFGESASEACAREFLEECGLTVRPAVAPAFVCELRFKQGRTRRHEVTAVFHVEHLPTPECPTLSAEPRSREEKLGFEWVDLAAVVDFDLRPAPIRAWLASGGLGGAGGGGGRAILGPGEGGTLWISHAEPA
ncbi:MAG: NUDIX domain-containing protein [Planctomycetota bacterium]|nr:NUDIX domain-containing protein [Planctomycetota bacterium]